jgi:Xaa-Pro aminopeptidase
MSRHALRRTQAWSAAAEQSGLLNGDPGIRSGDADGFLVTSLTHVRYLTGFSGSNAALILTDGAAILITDGRYVTQAEVEAPDVEIMLSRNVMAGFVDFVRAQPGRRW